MDDNINYTRFCPNGTAYQIKPGDTLSSLARRFNTTVSAIIAENPGIDPNNLQLGQNICIPVPPTPGTCPGGFIVIIRAGDTFYSLARRYSISVEALIAANPGVDFNLLRPGQRICIPSAAPPSPPPVCPGGTYTVRLGDTFYSIARRFGVSVQALIDANPGVDFNRLRVGQTICLPRGVPGPIPCPGGQLYRIQAGDTLSSIARRNNISLQRLASANPHLTDPDRLQIGTVICIPPR